MVGGILLVQKVCELGDFYGWSYLNTVLFLIGRSKNVGSLKKK